ncbi:oxidoreductase short chain dehydrogenase/reductase family protein [Anaeramoeba ignava]|uniref:Oxidoreductase short chain dehydrogenase/reductase family protein n=1 Tax=Anaeramoeba ignava TaxID=1746090 RepID=A0A9Q0LUX5_ANAIG|nr:oxidoreductase short chain dehydrogenase/reductase family protein [Anaeramoeba ignava]
MTHLIPYLVVKLSRRKMNNLKGKYGGKWGLVTGAASGIGKQLSIKLAKQDYNLILINKTTSDLNEMVSQLLIDFPNIKVEKLVIDFSDQNEKFEKLEKLVEELDVTVFFNNAGFSQVNDFVNFSWNQIMSEIQCNIVTNIKLTHIYMKKLIKSKKKSLIVFTSSMAHYLPIPWMILYPSCKAFITDFSISSSIHAKKYNIDFTVIHPGPVDGTQFFSIAKLNPKSLVMRITSLFSQSSESVADFIINGSGRFYSLDTSLLVCFLRLFMDLIGKDIIVSIFQLLIKIFHLDSSCLKKN